MRRRRGEKFVRKTGAAKAQGGRVSAPNQRHESVADKLRVCARQISPHVKSCASNPDNSWLFVFLPVLAIAAVLASRHFALPRVGQLEIRRGCEPAAAAIFESQLYDYSGDGVVAEGRKGENEGDNSVMIKSVLEVVARGGFSWAEGPLWVLRPGHEGDASYGRLLFSAVFDNSIFKIEYDGVSRFLRESGCRSKVHGNCNTLVEPGSNGIAYDPIDGGLYLCEHGSRSVSRLDEDGTHTPVATHVDGGKRLNSPNDLVFSSSGDLFFTDPTFGLQGADAGARDIPYCGVYHINREKLSHIENFEQRGAPQINIEASLLTSKVPTPNGLAFSPDESVLYIANSGPDPAIMAFDVVWHEEVKTKSQPTISSKGELSATDSAHGKHKKSLSSNKKIKKERQSLDELLRELDEEDEEDEESNEVTKTNIVVDNVNQKSKEAGDRSKETFTENMLKTTKDNADDASENFGQRVTLKNQRIFADVAKISKRCDKSASRTSNDEIELYNGPDGLKVDALGNVYMAGACGVHIFRPSDGKRVASLLLPGVRVSNIAFAGDGHLYVTASDRVLRIKLGKSVLPALPERMINGEKIGREHDDSTETVTDYFW